jgi:hypothetical protein
MASRLYFDGMNYRQAIATLDGIFGLTIPASQPDKPTLEKLSDFDLYLQKYHGQLYGLGLNKGYCRTEQTFRRWTGSMEVQSKAVDHATARQWEQTEPSTSGDMRWWKQRGGDPEGTEEDEGEDLRRQKPNRSCFGLSVSCRKSIFDPCVRVHAVHLCISHHENKNSHGREPCGTVAAVLARAQFIWVVQSKESTKLHQCS